MPLSHLHTSNSFVWASHKCCGRVTGPLPAIRVMGPRLMMPHLPRVGLPAGRSRPDEWPPQGKSGSIACLWRCLHHLHGPCRSMSMSESTGSSSPAVSCWRSRPKGRFVAMGGSLAISDLLVSGVCRVFRVCAAACMLGSRCLVLLDFEDACGFFPAVIFCWAPAFRPRLQCATHRLRLP